MRSIHSPLSQPTASAISGLVVGLTQEEQKLVDAAREILMRQRNLNADEAYLMLAEMAEKRKIGLADFSLQLVEITKMLTI